MFDGGIFIDENDRYRFKGKPVVDVDDKTKSKASKLKKEDLLFPEDDEFEEILPAEKKKKDKSERKAKGESRSRAMIEIPQDLLDEFGDIHSTFEPERATKKQFRQYRKILSELCNVRYPKKKREKKTKKKK